MMIYTFFIHFQLTTKSRVCVNILFNGYYDFGFNFDLFVIVFRAIIYADNKICNKSTMSVITVID